MRLPYCLAVLLIAGPVIAAADDLEDSFQKLKEAESKKDAALVKKLAGETCALARKAEAEPAPSDATEKEAWEQHVTYAKQIEVNTEYTLYAVAVQSPPATMIDLLSALEAQNPKSQYLANAYGSYFYALQQTGAGAKIPAVAEKALGNFPDNEDLLMVMADAALTRNQLARAGGYAERLVAAVNKHGKPGSAAEEKKRNTELGRGYWICGMAHNEKAQYSEADKDLRAALPLVKNNEGVLASVLFHLGLVNYQLGRMTANRAQVVEAAKFSEEAAKIPGPLAGRADQNARAMRTDALKMR
jgi:hypothetical protein